MDMRDTSAMTEASGLTNEKGSMAQASRARPRRKDERALGSSSPDVAVRFTDQLRDVTTKAPLQSFFVAFLLGVGWARRR
jgi:hypothetical protein